MSTWKNLEDKHTSVLSALRAMMPNRPLQIGEALCIAERQADRLRRLRGHDTAPIELNLIEALPRLAIEDDPELPRQAASGVAYWNYARRTWIIGLNPDEPRTRRHFSALHEFKHIVDHGHPGMVAARGRPARRLDPAECVADFFAGCVLVPKVLLKAAFFDGIQRVEDLAELFDVSRRAIEVRLSQVGLVYGEGDNFRTPHAVRRRHGRAVSRVLEPAR